MSVSGADRFSQGYHPQSQTDPQVSTKQGPAPSTSPGANRAANDGFDASRAALASSSSPTSDAGGAIDYGQDAPVDVKQLVNLLHSLEGMLTQQQGTSPTQGGQSNAFSTTDSDALGTNQFGDKPLRSDDATSTGYNSLGTGICDPSVSIATSNGSSYGNGTLSMDTSDTSSTDTTDFTDSAYSLSTETTSASIDPTLSSDQTASGTDVDSLYPSGTPSTKDVNQGAMGDCYALSGMASMAATSQGQDLIKSAINKTSDSPATYDVKMYSPDGKPVTISVDGDMVNNGVRGSNNETNWSTLLEKAYAKYNDQFDIDQSSAGGYAGISNGGYAGDFLTAMTGKSATYSAPFTTNGTSVDPADVKQSLESSLSSGKFVEAHSNDATTSSGMGSEVIGHTSSGTDIIGSHAYSVLAVNGDTVTLRNPWGDKGSKTAGANASDPGTVTMSMAEFVKNFQFTATSS